MQTSCLQLCEWGESSKYGAAQCYPRYDGGCQGAYDNHCSPHVIWGNITSSGAPDSAHFNYGSLNFSVDYTTPWSFSVRCVLDLNCTCADSILQLCERYESSKYGAARCWEYYGGCQGAAYGTGNATNCYPYHVWSASKAGSDYWAPGLNNGAWDSTFACGTGHCSGSLAFSVRCVLDLTQNADGLQLCDYQPSSSYGAAQCSGLSGGCQGSADNYCWPGDMWSGSEVGSSSYHRGFGLMSSILQYTPNFCGAGMYGKCTGIYAFTVRCVLDLKTT